MRDTKYWLWLSMVFGAGNRRIWEAMRLFENAKEAYEELSSGSLNDRLNETELRSVKSTDIDNAVEHMKYCEKLGIGIIGYSDAEYPTQLRHILNPPAVLYYKGNISCLSGTRTVTTVGTRRAGDYSLYAADRICRELAKSGIVIVSGFAVGIDITTHLAAVSVNRPTVCVMGCGLDVDYPRDNFRHREAILSNGGLFISEYPPGTPPHSPNFPKRNRILAALGKITIVFEAARKSGSLITAGLALEQGREVFCLPPADIFSESFSGNSALLRDGASALYSASDILDCFRIGGANDSEIRFDTYDGISTFGVRELSARRMRTDDENKAPKQRTKKQRSADSSAEAPADEESSVQELLAEKKAPDTELYESLTEIQKRIIDEISGGNNHADAIANKLEVDAEELVSELTELELLGVIRALPGKMFGLC
ncbi:MAG: DNA-processing protein DprA [Ruminococcus sp.]|nr:DNA-processing protein DprA [Ruminococcus sp.]